MTHGLADHVRALLQMDALEIAKSDWNASSEKKDERQRLLACGEALAAKGRLRWDPVLESGAILCEELSRDHLALAGALVRADMS